jgi:hypothetical protein
MTTTPPPLRASTSAEGRRQAVLTALERAGARHSATTPSVFLIELADRLRRHEGYDSYGLGHVIAWIDDLRRQQPEGAPMIIGHDGIGRLIDRIVVAFSRDFPDPPGDAFNLLAFEAEAEIPATTGINEAADAAPAEKEEGNIK